MKGDVRGLTNTFVNPIRVTYKDSGSIHPSISRSFYGFFNNREKISSINYCIVVNS